MIRLPEDDWDSGAPSDGRARTDSDGSLLTGAAAPLPLGTLTIPNDPHLMEKIAPDDDSIARAAAMSERAGTVFKRQRAVGAFNRELDGLFATIAEDPDWAAGLRRFDEGLAELRRKHTADLSAPEDRAAFERHAEQFGAMQRIGVKRVLTERQQADALTQLDEQLDYYAGKATTAPNEVFRSIAIDSGLKAIHELSEAGYLFPESARKLQTAFRSRLDNADLEAIVKADPAGGATLLDDARLFPNADGATRDRLRQQVAGLVTGLASDAAPGLGRTLGYIARELGRAGDHPESTKKDPVLGVSVGAGEMPDMEAKRNYGPEDVRKDPERKAPYSKDEPGYHRYVQGPTPLGTVAGGLTEDMVKDALRRFAVPGQDPAHRVEHDKIYAVFPPGGRGSHYSVGNVHTTIGDDGMSIVNDAQKGHVFYPGRITRRIHLENGTWYVTTTGEGNNERPLMDTANQEGGPIVFELVDNQMKKYIRDQLAK